MIYINIRDETRGACSTHKGEGECLLGLVGKPKEKRPLRRPRSRREDKIKMNLNKYDWSHVTMVRDKWRAFMRTAMNIFIP